MKKQVKILTVSAIMIALSTVLSFLKVYDLPLGGSLTVFSMVPVCMIGIMYGVKKAILKQNSPSCGSAHIYDGTFSGRLVSGMGVTARLFSESGIEVKGEKE